MIQMFSALAPSISMCYLNGLLLIPFKSDTAVAVSVFVLCSTLRVRYIVICHSNGLFKCFYLNVFHRNVFAEMGLKGILNLRP